MQIVLEDIRKYFGEVKANDGINLTFEPGKIYGILGENGAGKSTLMKIVSGYQAPDSGQIRKDGQAVSFRSPQEALAAGIGMLYQDPLDIPPFNIVENYLLGKNNKFILNKTEAVSHLQELARRYGFQVDVESRIDALSIGERQQLELVRLLAGGAQTLILDEPTTGISADQQEILFDSLRKLAHEEGKTLITVSHKLEDVQELCEQAFVLRKGKLVGGAEIPCPNQT
ncbi:MAG: ATP-binding cassette domain-containing protein, partial [Anaerolineae bacterium]|nr:ATP-binding cassette domain-containing protein [Anaerolineae bacterium]